MQWPSAGSMTNQSLMKPKGVVAGAWLDIMSVAAKAHMTLLEKDQPENACGYICLQQRPLMLQPACSLSSVVLGYHLPRVDLQLRMLSIFCQSLGTLEKDYVLTID